MKPRFSILTLLGITAYVAVNVAAFAQPTTVWMAIAFWIAVAVVVSLLVVASAGTSDQSVFARGMLLGVLEYALFMQWEPGSWWWFNWSGKYYYADPHSNSFATADRQHLAKWNSQLAFGLIGGCLALWRYRRLERRAEREKSG